MYGAIIEEIQKIREALRQGENVNYTTSILPILLRLKQVCDHPALITKVTNPIYGRSEKFDWIMEKIEEICEGNEQVVVFSHFLDMLTLLELEK